jgi:hypothetical protein
MQSVVCEELSSDQSTFIGLQANEYEPLKE